MPVLDRGFYREHRDKPLRMGDASWLEQTGSICFFDDFIGKALNATDVWTATQTGSGTAWAHDGDAGDPVAGHGGWISCATENIDAAANELALTNESVKGLFRADRAGNGFLVFQTRLSISGALTARFINAGLTDDETEGAALAMSITTTTWTTTATNAVLAVFDSTATDNDNFLFQGVKADVDGTHVASTVAAAADTATVLRIEIDSTGVAYAYQSNGAVVEPAFQGRIAAAVTATTPLIPYLAVGSTTTTAATLEADYVLTACQR